MNNRVVDAGRPGTGMGNMPTWQTKWRWFAAAAVALAAAIAVRLRHDEPPSHWEPPTETESSQALSTLEDLSAKERRAFAPRGHEVKRPPQEGDWLINHFESGQSYVDFVQSAPNRPDAVRGKLYLQPLGTADRNHAPLLRQLAEFGERFFQLETVVQPTVDLPQTVTRRTNTRSGEEQLLTGDVLSLLKLRLPKDAYGVIGVTEVDLYQDPARNSVFGQADLRERVAIFSVARMDGHLSGTSGEPLDGRRFLRRSLDVFSHEVGHMYGMKHCVHYECLMNGSNSLQEADSQSPHLCPICLRKMAFTTQFDPAARCRSLAEFYETHNLDAEARWLRDRAGWIEEGK